VTGPRLAHVALALGAVALGIGAAFVFAPEDALAPLPGLARPPRETVAAGLDAAVASVTPPAPVRPMGDNGCRLVPRDSAFDSILAGDDLAVSLSLDAGVSPVLTAVLEQVDVRLKPCLRTAEARRVHLASGAVPSVRVGFVVVEREGKGQVREVQVVDSDFPGTRVSQCLERAASSLVLPAPQRHEPEEVSFQLDGR
jgi:hypothetical protein